MSKEELVHITLKQLRENFDSTPENFRFEDPVNSYASGSFPGPTLIWQFKVIVDDNKYIVDPLNSTKTIIVSYNKTAKQMSCHIYNREVNNLSTAIMADSFAVVQYNNYIPLFFNRTFRQFINLKKILILRKNEREFIDYMKKLGNIFPAAQDEELLK